MGHNNNLDKDVKVNNRDVKSNKHKFTTKANGEPRTNTFYHRNQSTFESEQAVSKLNQLDALIHSWVVGYDDLVVVYSSVKAQPLIQIQLVNPRFKPIRSSNYRQVYQDPLAELGVTITKDIISKTYYYHIPL